MLEAVADKLHDFNLFQLFFSQSGYRDFSVINIVGVAGRYGQVCWSVCLFRPEVLLNFLKESHSRDLIPRRQSGRSSTLPLLYRGGIKGGPVLPALLSLPPHAGPITCWVQPSAGESTSFSFTSWVGAQWRPLSHLIKAPWIVSFLFHPLYSFSLCWKQ